MRLLLRGVSKIPPDGLEFRLDLSKGVALKFAHGISKGRKGLDMGLQNRRSLTKLLRQFNTPLLIPLKAEVALELPQFESVKAALVAGQAGRGKLRLAEARDISQILAIYGPHCLHTTATLEDVVPSIEEMEARRTKILEKFPWIVWSDEGQVKGYAYAGPHRERVGYRFCTEVAIYLDPSAKGQGIGAQIYGALLSCLKHQNYLNCYAIVSASNQVSLDFHAKMGFHAAVCFKQIGFKFGKWHDVVWMERVLGGKEKNPDEPTSWKEVFNLES
jgi:L-amino acid N-acyltransferase YncA